MEGLTGDSKASWFAWCCYGALALYTSCRINSAVRKTCLWHDENALMQRAVLLFVIDMFINILHALMCAAVGGASPSFAFLLLVMHYAIQTSALIFCRAWKTRGSMSSWDQVLLYLVWLQVSCLEPMMPSTLSAAMVAAHTASLAWRCLFVVDFSDTGTVYVAVAFEVLIASISTNNLFVLSQKMDMSVLESWEIAFGVAGCQCTIALLALASRKAVKDGEMALRLQQLEQESQQQWQQHQQQQRDYEQKLRLLQETKIPLLQLHGQLGECRDVVDSETLRQLTAALDSLESVIDDLATFDTDTNPLQQVDESSLSEARPASDRSEQLPEAPRRRSRASINSDPSWGCGWAVLEGTSLAAMHIRRRINENLVRKVRAYLGGPAPSTNPASVHSSVPLRVTDRRAVDWDPETRTFLSGTVSISTPGGTTSSSYRSHRSPPESTASGQLMERAFLAPLRPEPFSGGN
eukprot:TRINITY_DN39749_c0_g1_i1.p1 TRINITY_DN39749_c0_g1~~TRINITY_DN39749_c0_g1_i1.p1  ORF type:complete len:465 (+),score=36.54 TRINITY_DN39749_c0_g1_i1:31-1425(+)